MEAISARIGGLKSRIATRAAKARRQAEKKLSRAIQRKIHDSVPNEISLSESWVDPFVALRLRHYFTERFYLNLYGTYGGFGINSDTLYSVAVGPGVVVNDWLTLELYYRHMSIDYENNGFVFDADMAGLFLGAVIEF